MILTILRSSDKTSQTNAQSPTEGKIDELCGVLSYQTHTKYLSLNQIARQPQNIPNPGEGGGQNQKLRSCGKPQVEQQLSQPSH
ncbi:hypothetical protein AVEN_49375-1, partial [Araneus ventricosus]